MLAIELRACQLDTKEALSRTGAHVLGDIAASLIATNGPPLSQVTLLLRQRFPDRQGMTFADVIARAMTWPTASNPPSPAPAPSRLYGPAKCLITSRARKPMR